MRRGRGMLVLLVLLGQFLCLLWKAHFVSTSSIYNQVFLSRQRLRGYFRVKLRNTQYIWRPPPFCTMSIGRNYPIFQIFLADIVEPDHGPSHRLCPPKTSLRQRRRPTAALAASRLCLPIPTSLTKPSLRSPPPQTESDPRK